MPEAGACPWRPDHPDGAALSIPSPRRQVAFCLSGRLRVDAGDGEMREFGAGAIWRMEDVSGSGHTTTVIGDEDVRLAIVQLADLEGR